MDTRSQIEVMAVETHQNCSYCSSHEGSAESWLQSMQITPEQYQMLLDRGWRRIGYYLCKPIVDKGCCRQYAIRSDALNFKLSKSQRRVLRKMRNFLMTEGEAEVKKWKSRERYQFQKGSVPGEKVLSGNQRRKISYQCPGSDTNHQLLEEGSSVDPPEYSLQRIPKVEKKIPRRGLGPDPNKPLCLKSKVRRVTKKQKNSQEVLQPIDNYEIIRSSIPHLNPTDEFKRKLEVVMVPAIEHDPHFRSTSAESFSIFKKFQMTVLKESESEWTFSKWARCFIDCPVPHDFEGTAPGYGNFHQQYILDGKIIAVGVITLIPDAFVTEYFYYDPDYGFLTMGVYSAVSEICFMNKQHRMDGRQKMYYLGAYTHSSSKMRYKLQFTPSELLCPHTYKWIPLQDCLPFLVSGRARLNPTSEDEEPDKNEIVRTTFDINKLLVSYEWDVMTYREYELLHYADEPDTARIEANKIEELEILKEYVTIVGDECATNIPLRVPPSLYPL